IWTATKKRDSDFLLTCHTQVMNPFKGIYLDAALVGEGFNVLFRKDPVAMYRKGLGPHEAIEKAIKKYDQIGDAIWTHGSKGRQWRFKNYYIPHYFNIPDDVYGGYFNHNMGYVYYMLPQVEKFNSAYLDSHHKKY